MAIYDPLRPQVLGPEWSPVRQESIPLDLSTEIGYTFSVTGSASDVTAPQIANWTASQVPTTLTQGQTPFVSLYRRGSEVDVGRVYRFVIPVSAVTVTGASATSGTEVAALSDPFDDLYVQLTSGDSNIRAFFNLGVNEDNILQNRRILKLNLLYTASGPFTEFDNDTNGVFASIESNTVVWSMGLGSITGPLSARDNVSISRVNLGDVNPFWNGGVSPFTYSERYPWRWEEINRFDSTEPIATRLAIGIRGSNLPTTTEPVLIGYVALEVVVCEENRLWYGGNASGFLSAQTNAFDPYEIANSITLRTTSLQTTGSLSPGDYTVTITLADAGDVYNRGDRPRVAALRQAEALAAPGPQGVLITKWQDPDGVAELLLSNTGILGPQFEFPGDPPTIETSDILPGIGVTNTGDIELDRTATHCFNIQIQANVLDDTVAQQVIVNNANGSQVFYPWVRFYARRFGTLSRTLRIRALTGIPASATIDQDTFDALPEIVDGWREVTLRFETATPSFSNTGAQSTWQWETINGSVTPQHKWEILGAYTDSIGNSEVTYGIDQNVAATFNNITRPLGNEVTNTFVDLTLMFSQDPIAVSGLAIETLSQEVTGIGLECSSLPECVPTGIAYHHITWSSGAIVCDTFSRSVTGGWDGTDTGQTYVTTGGSAGDYAVVNGMGTLTFTSGTGSRRTTLSGLTQTDPDLYAQFSIDQTPVGASLTLGFTARGTDTNNQYVLSARCNTDGTILALIERVIAGSFVNIGSGTVPDVQFFPDQVYNMRARLEGTSLRLRIWEEGADEPTIWHATATDATYSSGTVSGFRANVAAGYTGSYPVIFSVDNFLTSEVTVAGNTYELQRKDTVDETWQTIMVSSDICPIEFNDYEARIGVQSTYRIRLVNALRFPGPWSTEISNTLSSPGVFGVSDGNGVLIFTTNERQSGLSNLAHVMSWDRTIDEEFVFPEANTIQLQPMYQRDFFVAFHPTERGGEQFSRTLLVNNSAVPTGRLRDGFRSLRDMAWEDVSYVCVRNELGDRWFAAVIVPSGNVQRNRRLYLARVDIVEVTDTPSQVTLPEFLA